MSITIKQKFLLIMPAIILPFLFMIFKTLGGGQGITAINAKDSIGLNTNLPGAYLDPKQMLMNKLASYLRADEDSARKKQTEQRDPYHPYLTTKKQIDSVHKDSVRPRGDELLRKLDQLKQSLRQPSPPQTFRPIAEQLRTWTPPLTRARLPDTPAADPSLEKLNAMLDKVIRIQHPGEEHVTPGTVDNGTADQVLPADSASNAIAAVIPSNQELVTGGTIPLRLSEDVLIRGRKIPRGQWIYGIVTVNNDRMLVHIHSLRDDRNLYPVDMQVVDLDGLPGIHIPGMLSRDVAKQSADEGVSGLNLSTYDASLGAQAANAGIQAAKTLFSRKIRLVRVSVHAGYQVLLRNAKTSAPIRRQEANKNFPWTLGEVYQPPGFVPGGSFLERRRTEDMELDLQGIWLKDHLLWFALRWQNHSPIAYDPDYCRWFVRDRRVLKRTAEQELTIQPVVAPAMTAIEGDSTCDQWIGFKPFVLAKDKELVVEIGENNGGRVLELVIGHKQLLKAKIP